MRALWLSNANYRDLFKIIGKMNRREITEELGGRILANMLRYARLKYDKEEVEVEK